MFHFFEKFTVLRHTPFCFLEVRLLIKIQKDGIIFSDECLEGRVFCWVDKLLEPISKRGKLLENSNLGEELAGEHSGLPILTLNLEILGEFQENENIRPLFQYCKRGSRKNHINPHLWLQFYRLVEEMPSTREGAVLAREVNGILFPISFWI